MIGKGSTKFNILRSNARRFSTHPEVLHLGMGRVTDSVRYGMIPTGMQHFLLRIPSERVVPVGTYVRYGTCQNGYRTGI